MFFVENIKNKLGCRHKIKDACPEHFLYLLKDIIMKIPYKLLSISFISTFIFGCSSTSIQNEDKFDSS